MVYRGMPPLEGGLSLFVSNYQPLDWEDEPPPSTEIELRRELRWSLLKRFFFILKGHSYRLRDLESTLWKISMGPIKPHLFVTAIMSRFRFDPALRMDKLLLRLYRSFAEEEDKKSSRSVDWRDVLCSLMILREYQQVRTNVMHLLMAIFDVYIDTSNRQAVLLEDLQRVVRLPSVTEREASSALTWLSASLSSVAPTFGYKQRPRLVPKKVFLDMLDQCKVLVGVFQRQAWSRLTEDMRLGILEANEQRSAFRFEAENEKYMIKRAVRLYYFLICRRTYRAWQLFVSWVVRVRNCRAREMEKRMVRSLRWWQSRLSTLKRARLKRGATEALGDKCRKLHVIRRMKQWHVRRQVIERVERPYKTDNRWFKEGVRLLKAVWDQDATTRAFRRWFSSTWMEAAMDHAARHHSQQMLRRNFNAFTRYLAAVIAQTKKVKHEERVRDENQEWLMGQIERMQEELRAQEEEERRQEEERKKREQDELMRKKAWEAQRRKAEKQAADRAKLRAQAEARAARVQAVKQQLYDEHTALFQHRLDSEPTAARDIVDSWFDYNHMPTELGRDIVQKEFKQLKGRFFQPPRVGHEERENVLTSPVNIIFVYIDVVLNTQGVSLAELFRSYDKSDSGYMSHDDFFTFMKSLPMPLRREQINNIIQKVDVSGDGFVDLSELEAAQQEALKALGEPASPWKQYVDPAQSVMCYHNILTDEKVYDFKMTDAKLHEILHSNLMAAEYVRVRDQILKEEPLAWQEIVRTYSAGVIQRAFRGHLAWRGVKQESWRSELRLRYQREKEQAAAGEVIRRYVQMALAKRELRYLARICYQKVMDPATGEPYYLNFNTGVSQWERPRLLKRADEDVTLPWCTQYKPGDPSGVAYFYRPDTGEWSEEKPDGYLLCDVCRYHLAVRQCTGEGCDGARYCFGCFHQYHVWWSVRASRGDHEGVLMQPVSCDKCRERLACRRCNDCGEAMCKACYMRIHRNPLLAQHTWVEVA